MFKQKVAYTCLGNSARQNCFNKNIYSLELLFPRASDSTSFDVVYATFCNSLRKGLFLTIICFKQRSCTRSVLRLCRCDFIRNSCVLRWFLQQPVAEKSPIKHFTVSFDKASFFFSLVRFFSFSSQKKKRNEQSRKQSFLFVHFLSLLRCKKNSLFTVV